MAYVSSKKKPPAATAAPAATVPPAADHGIHLRHKVIRQISGPILSLLSFPRVDDFQAYLAQGVSLPIVWFLGEAHNHFYECTPCEEEKGCYTMRNTTLFQMLNDLATLTPIDIHVETNPSVIRPYAGEFGRESHGSHANGVSSSTIRNVSKRLYPTCFGPHKGVECVTPYLRFHYVDARVFHHTVEFYTMSPTIFTLLKMETVMTRGEHELRSVSSFHPSWTQRTPLVEYGHELASMIFQGLLVSKGTPMELFERFYERLFQRIEDVPLKQSSIQKQLRKLPERFQDKGFWMTGLRRVWSATLVYYLSHLEGYWKMVRGMPAEEREALHEMLQYMIQPDQPTRVLNEEEFRLLRRHLSAVTQFFIMITNHILDVYSIARMIKSPTGGVGPTLVVHLAGANHSKMMFELLRHLFEYRNAHMGSLEASGAACVSFGRRIALEEIVLERHAMRFPAGGPELESYQRWVQRATSVAQRSTLKRKAVVTVANAAAAAANASTHAKVPRSVRGGRRLSRKKRGRL